MYTDEMWLILAGAVIVSLLLGFFIGRREPSGSKGKAKDLLEEYEQTINQQQEELEAYRSQVHEHYDETATLFKDMAGSYKKLFDHLSVGSEKLGDFSEKRILPERAGALLDEPDTDAAKDTNFIDPNHAADEDALNRKNL